MPQTNRRSIRIKDQQIINALIGKLNYFPKLQLIAKSNNFLPVRTHIWNGW